MNENIRKSSSALAEEKLYDNQMEITFDSLSKNESFARTVVAAFVSQLNPTLEEIADIKTAVSEAVTNCIIHAYRNTIGKIDIRCEITGSEITIQIADTGVGIPDVAKAMEPLYTTSPELERSGMGFAFMNAFMDELNVISKVNQGTCIQMKKRISAT